MVVMRRRIYVGPKLAPGLFHWMVTVEEYVGDTDDGASEIWAQSRWFFKGLGAKKEAFRFAAHYKSTETEPAIEEEEKVRAKGI